MANQAANIEKPKRILKETHELFPQGVLKRYLVRITIGFSFLKLQEKSWEEFLQRTFRKKNRESF